jgi:ERF superfamily
MGAALTYARRYALFALVGIAGEDDLDAPDLVTPTNVTSDPEKAREETVRPADGSRRAPQGAPLPRNGAKNDGMKPLLDLAASAELRDRLLAELNALASADGATHWAHQSLRAKNNLTASDAERVEKAFQAKLTAFGAGAEEELSATPRLA